MRTTRRLGTGLVGVVAALASTAGTACAPSTPDVAVTGTTPTSGRVPTTAPATTAPAPVDHLSVVDTPFGAALGTEAGLPVYTWDQEEDGTTVCADAACLELWPPVLAAGDRVEADAGLDLGPGRVALVDGPSGGRQVTLDGRRLYTMSVDVPGQAACQGSDGWWILHTDGTKNDSTTPVTTT